MPQHFRCSIVQSKARRRQATIGWLHPCKAKIDQSDLSVVSLTFIQQVLQFTASLVNTMLVIIIIIVAADTTIKATATAAVIITYLMPNSCKR